MGLSIPWVPDSFPLRIHSSAVQFEPETDLRVWSIAKVPHHEKQFVEFRPAAIAFVPPGKAQGARCGQAIMAPIESLHDFPLALGTLEPDTHQVIQTEYDPGFLGHVSSYFFSLAFRSASV